MNRLFSSKLSVLLALVPPLVALSIQWTFWPSLQPQVFVLFYPAVIASSWIGGLRGGVAGTAFAAALIWFFFVPRQLSFVIEEPRMLLGLGVFSGLGVLFSLLNERLRAANQKLEERVAQRTLELEASCKSIEYSEARMAGIVGSAMDAIISVNSEQTIILFNTAAEAMFRYTAAEAMGQPLDRFIPQRFREAHKQHVKDFGQTSHTSRSMRSLGALSGVRANGDEFPIEASISQVEVAGQKTYTVILRDITERKEAEEALLESEARFAKAFHSNPAAMCITTIKNGRFIEVNERYCQMFGLTREELIGQSSVELALWADPATRTSIMDQLQSHGFIRDHETQFLRKNRDLLNALISMELIEFPGEHEPVVVSMFFDVTGRKQAEAERIRLLHVLEASLNEIYIFDAQTLRFEYVNDCARRNLGYSMEAMSALTPVDLKPEFSTATFNEAIGPLRRHEKEKLVFQTVHRRAGGSLYPVEVHLQLVERDGDAVFLAVINDITERKQAEERVRASETRYRRLFETTKDGLLILEAETGMVLDVNPFLIELLGFSHEEFLGKKIWELGFFKDIVANHDNFAELQQKEYMRYEDMALETSDGRRIEVEFTSNVFRMNEQKVIQCSIRDISVRKATEAEIRLLNDELEQRVLERTGQLEAANKELEAFSYSVSHDLRAPLRAVDGFSRAVLEDYGTLLPAEGQRYLQTIRDGAQRMGLLIDDLLSFSRLSRLPLNKRTLDTEKLVQDALAELTNAREGRQIDLRIGDLPPCVGDPALLKQVWINLLSNAFKYSQKREVAIVEIGCEQKPEGSVYFVRDNGTGFDMRYANKLFGVFQRLHRAEEYPGTGVGLAIVQRVIHRHGGRIWAEAELERGATFYFTLAAPSPS